MCAGFIGRRHVRVSWVCTKEQNHWVMLYFYTKPLKELPDHLPKQLRRFTFPPAASEASSSSTGSQGPGPDSGPRQRLSSRTLKKMPPSGKSVWRDLEDGSSGSTARPERDSEGQLWALRPGLRPLSLLCTCPYFLQSWGFLCRPLTLQMACDSPVWAPSRVLGVVSGPLTPVMDVYNAQASRALATRPNHVLCSSALHTFHFFLLLPHSFITVFLHCHAVPFCPHFTDEESEALRGEGGRTAHTTQPVSGTVRIWTSSLTTGPPWEGRLRGTLPFKASSTERASVVCCGETNSHKPPSARWKAPSSAGPSAGLRSLGALQGVAGLTCKVSARPSCCPRGPGQTHARNRSPWHHSAPCGCRTCWRSAGTLPASRGLRSPHPRPRSLPSAKPGRENLPPSH